MLSFLKNSLFNKVEAFQINLMANSGLKFAPGAASDSDVVNLITQTTPDLDNKRISSKMETGGSDRSFKSPKSKKEKGNNVNEKKEAKKLKPVDKIKLDIKQRLEMENK